MNERSLAELGGSITSFRGPKGISVGAKFRCPTCPDAERHYVIVTWAGPSLFSSGAVWKLESAPELGVLTLSPSINCDVAPVYPEWWSEDDKQHAEATRCRFHGWVRAGKVSW